LGEARRSLMTSAADAEPAHWDTAALVSVLLDQWQAVFSRKLSPSCRTYVHDIRDARNRWAHQQPFSTDDLYRAVDSTVRLLTAISAPQARVVEEQKKELVRLLFAEQAKRIPQRAAAVRVESKPLRAAAHGQEQLYGINKWSYGVVPLRNGTIELRVYHHNQNVRTALDLHRDHPSYFLDHLQGYRNHPAAGKWLTKVIEDHRSYFARNAVRINLNPGPPPP
ncbi:MAG: Swt1 family HEPN domain-containing protein, partial [Chloroflexi bacterium]|nr:Swt1 family HEPN domain-containing protein [Chloroflexota bacterium]